MYCFPYRSNKTTYIECIACFICCFGIRKETCNDKYIETVILSCFNYYVLALIFLSLLTKFHGVFMT